MEGWRGTGPLGFNAKETDRWGKNQTGYGARRFRLWPRGENKVENRQGTGPPSWMGKTKQGTGPPSKMVVSKQRENNECMGLGGFKAKGHHYGCKKGSRQLCRAFVAAAFWGFLARPGSVDSFRGCLECKRRPQGETDSLYPRHAALFKTTTALHPVCFLLLLF